MLGLFAALGLTHRYNLGPVDDAYISLRYASNWAAGHGVTFNIGERVEGFTNFLLVALQALLIRFGVAPETALNLVPWAALAALAGMFAWFTARHIFVERPVVAAAAGVLIAVHPVLLCWTTSGMESTLFALFVFASAARAFTAMRRRDTIAAAVLLVLAGMTRPEAAAMAPVIAWGLYRRVRSRREAALNLVLFGIGFGVFFAWRAVYFGQLLPNTFYAKLDYGNTALAKRGLLYVWDFLRGAALVTLLAAFGLRKIRSAPVWVSGFAVLLVVHLAVVTYEGGDHFAMFRFLTPAVPLITALALYACASMSDATGPAGNVSAITRDSRARLATYWPIVGLAVVGVSHLSLARQDKRHEKGVISEFDRFRDEAAYAREWSAIGSWLQENAGGASVCTVPIGAIGYYSGLYIIDPHGLIDPTIARQRGKLGTGYAGHEKFDLDRVLAKQPGIILLLHFSSLAPVPENQLEPFLWGNFAIQLHRDPRLRADYRYESVPIGRKFLNLYVRSDLASRDRGKPNNG